MEGDGRNSKNSLSTFGTASALDWPIDETYLLNSLAIITLSEIMKFSSF